MWPSTPCQFGLTSRGRGLGWIVMQAIVEYARHEGIRRVECQVLSDNTTVLTMCREFGFAIAPDPNDASSCIVQLEFRPFVETSVNQ